LAQYLDARPHPKRRSGGLREPGNHTTDEPLVSVVTVARNAAGLIAQTIESVAAQTYPNIEYIVIDGASTDATVEAIREHEQTVTRWVSEPDGGIYDAMNKGIALCTGRYVKLLNADDLLPPDSVARAVAAFRSTPPGDCVYGDIRLMDLSSKEFGFITPQGGIRFFTPFLHPAWYVPMATYRSFGLYRTDFRIASDYEYHLRLVQGGVRFHHLGGSPLACFRTNGASSSLRGVKEGFVINREYQGIGRASYVFSVHLFKKLRSRLVDSLLGERMAHRVRTAVHERRRSKQGVNP